MSSIYRVSEELTLSYAAPILARQHREAQPVNRALLRQILRREQQGPGLQVSNAGGWHSRPDLLDWPGEDIRQLVGWIGQASNALAKQAFAPDVRPGKVDINAWANVSRRGDYVRPHTHPGWDLSGVYYVSVGQSVEQEGLSGAIEFIDPRCGAGMLNSPGHPFTGTVQFRPCDGLLLMFPSWLSHYVHPYAGDSVRVSIGFNVQVVTTTN